MKFPFLEGGGELGELTRNYDWSTSPLGMPNQWPQSLRTTISILLNSSFPMFLFWGPESICFYNDAYRPSLGMEGRHPATLGSRGEEAWADIWPIIQPLIEQILAGGEAIHSEDGYLSMQRDGRMVDTYWTSSYSPVKDEAGQVAGVFVTCNETTEKVQSLRQSEASRQELEFAIEATELGTFDLNPATGKFTANARLKAWFGLRPDEEIPLSLAVEAIAEKDRQRVADAIARAMEYESGGSYDIAYALQPGGGVEERIVRAKGRVWFSEDKTAYRFNGTVQNITTERKAREERASARALADLAVKSARIGIFNIHIEDGTMEYTPEFADILTGDALKRGLTRKAFADYIHPDDEPLRAAAEQTVMRTGRFDYETRVIRDDGSVSHLQIMGVMVIDAAGHPQLFSGAIRDITEQRTARQKLEEAEATMRGAVELAQLGTWDIDAKTGVFNASERLQSWFGFSEGEDVYTTGHNPIHERDRDRVAAAIAEALRPGSDGTYDIEYTIVAYRTGKERIQHAYGKVILDKAGAPLCLKGTAQDVTVQRQIQLALESEVQERTEELAASNEELRKANEELAGANSSLLHSNEELAQYAYVASHDLQEPLRKIQVFTGMLAGQKEIPESSKQMINKIVSSSERMRLLIRDLLDFSRLLKSDQLMRPVNLTGVMSAVAADFELTVEEKAAVIEIGELPIITAVSLQMNQLFYNLLSNALKFTDGARPPRIRVSARKMKPEELQEHIRQPLPFSDYYEIIFEDNGIGFETTYAEQIFEVFKRLHGRDTYPGSGIGLALCRRIVANHQGIIYTESTPGVGTTFHIMLPQKQHEHTFEPAENYTMPETSNPN